MKNTNAFNSTFCKNCSDILITKFLSITDEERKQGVHTKYARVHKANELWECPDGSGLNPHSDDIMPVMFLALKDLNGNSRTKTTSGRSS